MESPRDPEDHKGEDSNEDEEDEVNNDLTTSGRLRFRTAIPDLKLLPVNYDNPPDEEAVEASPRGSSSSSSSTENGGVTPRDPIIERKDITFSTHTGRKKIHSGSIYSIVNYFLFDKEAGWLGTQNL